MKFKSDFLNELNERGLIYQHTDLEKLDERLSKGKTVGYGGFDLTAPSQTIGNLVLITLLKWLQKTGHKPIIVLGGATSRIGDPSFKDKERPLLTLDQIKTHMEGAKKSISKHIDLKKDAILVDNYSWFKDIKYIDFLRDIGKNYSVHRMLSFESVKKRLNSDQFFSFLEFNYMLLQGYDFIHLNKKYNCELELCGADQWGNSICGYELGQKLLNKNLHILSAPLITDAQSKKIGKSEGNAVWLNEEFTSPYEYYQYWRNIDDSLISQMLRIFTELPMPEIKKLDKLEGEEINEAKKILAYEATKLNHGEKEAKKAEQTSRETFETGGLGKDLPKISISKSDLKKGINILNLYLKSGLVSSKGEARRLIRGGGAYLNDQKITDENLKMTENDIKNEAKLSSGKKKHIIIETE
jgi:tyrosyl-tRNA synthetase